MRKLFSYLHRSFQLPGLLLLAVLLCQGTYSSAQDDIDFAACPNPQFIYQDAVKGNPISPALVIEAVGPGPAATMSILNISYETAGFEFSLCDNCASPTAIYGVTINASGATVTISGTPLESGKTIIFTIRADKGAGNICDRTYRLPLIAKPIDLVLVLDRSGSMGSAYNGSYPPPANQRRWDGLLTGVDVLRTNLQGMGVLKTGDKLGMRMFASGPNVITPAAPYNGALIDALTNVATMRSVLSGVTPDGNTALGDGIIAGRDILLAGPASDNKAMLVFSDGMQNEGDQVNVSGANQYTHTAGNQKLSGPSNEIKIHTICLGSTGVNPMLMNGIATANGGHTLNTLAGAEADFTTFFASQLANILAGNTPQVIDITRGAFPAMSSPAIASHTFSTNKGTSAVVVTLLAPSRNEPRFTSITKDGVELIQFAQRSSGSGFVSIAVRYPVNGSPVKLAGDWKVTVQSGTTSQLAVPFTMMVMADDHLVDPVYSLGAGNFKVDDTFKPSISIVSTGRALKNVTITGAVFNQDDINDLVARSTVKFDSPATDPGSPDIAKLAVLLQDSAFLALIKAKNNALNMAFNAADSTYTGSFNGLTTSGVYQVIYKITGDDPVLGKIERFHQETFYVRFKDIDLPNSQLVVTTNAGGFSVITFKPQASNKKLIGAGWKSAISFESAGLKATNIVDKGDGSYEITLDGKLTGSFKLNIADEKVFDGSTADLGCYGPNPNIIQRIKCWLMGMGLPAWSIWILLLIILLLLWAIIKKLKK